MKAELMRKFFIN